MATMHQLYATIADWYTVLPGSEFAKVVTPEDLDALKQRLLPLLAKEAVRVAKDDEGKK